MAKKIFLSPSNQYDNRYAYGNTTEDVQCGRIAEACKVALERCDFEVKLEQYDTMANRVKHSNAWKADMHVPIHTNAFNKKVTGTRLFCYSKTGPGYKACHAVFKYLAPLTPGESENISVNKGLYELAATDMCSVYIEAEFHDNKDTAKWIIENVVEIGEAIAHGICDYFNYDWVEPESTSEESKETVKKEAKYFVQAGAYGEKSNAENLVKKLKEAGFNAIIKVKEETDVKQEEVVKQEPAKKTNAEIAQEIFKGICSDSRWSSWGNGSVRAERLKAAGYDPDAVQKEVNKLF